MIEFVKLNERDVILETQGITKRLTRVVALTVSVIVASMSFGSLADDSQSDFQIEEVIVTATKRGTSLMETPIPVSAVTGHQLSRSNITDVTSLNKQVPGLQIGDQSNGERGSLEISMRGISTSNTSETGDPSVGYHVDGIYVSRPNAVGQLMHDVERVEVLRGPQGTLFGRNSTVGAINVISKKPDLDEFSGNMEVGIGNYNDRVYRGVLNVPVTDSLAFRATVMNQDRDSYQDVTVNDLTEVDGFVQLWGMDAWIDPDSDTYSRQAYRKYAEGRGGSYDGYGAKDHYAYRVSMLFEPAAGNFSWNLSWEAYQNDAPWPANEVNCDYHLCGKYPAFRNRRDETGPYRARVNAPGFLDQSSSMLRSVAFYEFGDVVSAKWSYGRSVYTHDLFLDVSGGKSDFDLYFDETWETNSQSHELQFTSLAGGSLQWIAGLFWFDEATELAIAYPYQPWGWGGDYVPERGAESKAVYFDSTYDITDKLQLIIGGRYTKDERRDAGTDKFLSDGTPAEDWLVYENMPGDWWENALRENPSLRADNSAVAGSRKWEYGDYKIGFNYQYKDDILLYTTLSTGHKAGSMRAFIVQRRKGISELSTYDPEKVTNFEFGVKTDLLDGRARIQANYFIAKIEDKQEANTVDFGDLYCDLNGDGDHGDPGEEDVGCGASGPGFVDLPNSVPPAAFPAGHDASDYIFDNQVIFQIMDNVAEIKFSGLELDFVWDITPSDHLSGYFTYLDNEILGWSNDDDIPGFNYGSEVLYYGATAGGYKGISLDGNRYQFAPDFSLNLNYSHDFNFSDGSLLVATISVNYVDDYYLTAFNRGVVETDSQGNPVRDYGTVDLSTPPDGIADWTAPREGGPAGNKFNSDLVEAHANVDASISWTSAGDLSYAALWATNLTNREVLAGKNRGWPTFKPPRMYGLKVGYRF